MMNSITTRPIIIFSTPRTGSTVLGEYVKSLCNDSDLVYFLEPDHQGRAGIEEFEKHFNQSKNFIIKLHYMHLYRYGRMMAEYLKTSDQAYRIRIRRKDIVQQIASFYIALSRQNKWHFKHEDQPDHAAIILHPAKLNQAKWYILHSNQDLDTSPVKFDMDLFYEDLPKIEDPKYRPTPEPANYAEILQAVRDIL